MPMPMPTIGAQINTQTKFAPETATKAKPTDPIMRQIGPAITTLRSRLPCSPAESAAAILISNVLAVVSLPLVLLWLGV